MFRANLPLAFWGESVLTATYLINRLPSTVLDNRTPYELLLGRPPTYGHLRVFSCLAYGKDTHKSLSKFSERGHPSIFVGYPSQHKGYRLWDLAARKFYVSRDVVFIKHVFPFHAGETTAPSSILVFPRLVPPPPFDNPDLTATAERHEFDSDDEGASDSSEMPDDPPLRVQLPQKPLLPSPRFDAVTRCSLCLVILLCMTRTCLLPTYLIP
ncbi:unnamed protein product [Linum trigynum]